MVEADKLLSVFLHGIDDIRPMLGIKGKGMQWLMVYVRNRDNDIDMRTIFASSNNSACLIGQIMSANPDKLLVSGF